jgi:hypothetical protein
MLHSWIGEKMFDSIDRVLLWQKLLNSNVSSKMISALKAMYVNVRSKINYNNTLSDHIHSYIGVKQGDPASSILCLFFLNDILNSIHSDMDGIVSIDDLKLFLLLFADDAALFATNPNTLQSMLCNVETYCQTWKLRLNTKKTKIMIFERGRPTSYNFYLYNTKLEVVDSFKYLGVCLFKNGNWNRTQIRIAQHASAALHKLFIVYNQLNLPTSQKTHLYETLVFPILNYSAEIWGHHRAPDIESLNSKFCRKVLGVRQSTNLDALYGELGRLPLYIHRKLLILKYWIKILSLSEDSILFKIFVMLKLDADRGNTYNGQNWAHIVYEILHEYRLTHLWHEQFNFQVELSTVQKRITDCYNRLWYTNINNSNRLRTYCLFKHEFCTEKYLDYINTPKYRSALTRFRVSSHDLQIERGRYLNTPREQRLCNNCHLRQVESEYHFLLICPKHKSIREKYIKRYYYTWPTIQKFTNLLNATGKKTIINLSKYIFYASKQNP